jgi:glycosyltransferase involved in cell wall biosynthesis
MLQDKNSLTAMGTKLKIHVTDNFTWDMVAERYLSLYKKILR